MMPGCKLIFTHSSRSPSVHSDPENGCKSADTPVEESTSPWQHNERLGTPKREKCHETFSDESCHCYSYFNPLSFHFNVPPFRTDFTMTFNRKTPLRTALCDWKTSYEGRITGFKSKLWPNTH